MDLEKELQSIQTKTQEAAKQLNAIEERKQGILQEILRLDGEARAIVRLLEQQKKKVEDKK